MYEDTVFELSTKLLSNEITIDLYRNLVLGKGRKVAKP
jgi:hypothetical protein